jgi:hypothetical protein
MNENEKEIRMTDFDYQFSDPRIQMVKAAIPYFPAQQQRLLSMLIRFQETRRTMEMLSGGEVAAMELDSEPHRAHSAIEILQAMKPYAGPREREIIEMFENMQLMLQAMQTTAQPTIDRNPS